MELKGRRNRSLGPWGELTVLPLPPEVVADETPAVQAVLRADTKRLKLLEEERRLQGQLEQGDDTAAERLEKVEEMAQGTQTKTWGFLGPSGMCPLLPPPRCMRNCGLPGQQLQRPKPGGSWLVWVSTLKCRIGPHRSFRGAGACVSPWPGGLPTSLLSLLASTHPDSLPSSHFSKASREVQGYFLFLYGVVRLEVVSPFFSLPVVYYPCLLHRSSLRID